MLHVLISRWKPKAGFADFLYRQFDEWLEALRLKCQLTVIEGDFDYAEAIERVQPDFVIFESWRQLRPLPPKITNVRSHPEVPRLLFSADDPQSPARVSTLWWMEQLGIESVFVLAHNFLQTTPDLVGRVQSVSHFIDEDVFKDYGLEKTIPVSVFGGMRWAGYYAWRAKAVVNLVNRLPTLIYTHPGYQKTPEHPFAVDGAAYARVLNQSHFSLADTTRMHGVVRKHLEIPASGAILVAPNTPGLDAWGFVDGENCILGSETEIIDKIIDVYRDPERYARIRAGGMALVRERYTKSVWNGFLRWYDCARHKQPDQRIEQQGLFGDFRLMPADDGGPAMSGFVAADNDYTLAMKQALAQMQSDDGVQDAEKTLVDLLNWGQDFRDAWLVLGVVLLLRGQPAQARDCITRAFRRREAEDGLAVWDPVELSWLLLIGVIQKDFQLVAAMCAEALAVRHVAVRRMQWALGGMLGIERPAAEELVGRQPGDRLSMHWLGREDFDSWLGLIQRVLAANGQPALL